LYSWSGPVLERAIKAAKNAMLTAGLDPRISPEIDHLFVNFSIVEVLEKLRKSVPSDILHRGWDAYHSVDVAGIEPFPDVKPTLTKLRDRGIRTAIVTRGIEEQQRRKIDQLQLTSYVDKIYYVDYDPTKKDAFRQFSSDFGIDFSEMMVVGDKPFGEIRYGNKLGAFTVQMVYGKYANRKPVGRLDIPTYKIHRFSEILSIINNINERKSTRV